MNAEERIEQLLALWQRERDAEREREAAERSQTTLAQRIARGRALRAVEVEETTAASGGRTTLWIELQPEEARAFRASPGAPVLLWHETVDDPTSIRGILGRRKGTRLGVIVDAFPHERYLTGTFNLDLESPEVTFERGARALRTLARAKPSSDSGRVAAALFDDDPPSQTLRLPEIEWFDDTLNEPQRDAVRHALTTEPLALIHGPPGTGKTRTLVEVTRQFVRQNKRVLVAAASNAAVDNLAERLIECHVPVVRLGHPARVATTVESHTLDALLEARPDYALARGWIEEANALRRRTHVRSDRGALDRGERRAAFAEARQLMTDARNHLRGLEEAILASARVVACTLTGADSALLGERIFDVAIIDEATQAADPLTAIAATRAAQIVLAGDPHQLPPTIVDPSAARDGLGRTVFDRRAASASLLIVQHRMHEAIMEFPSDSMYGGRLQAHPSVAGHALAVDDPLRPGPNVFVDTAGKGWSEELDPTTNSTRNPGQAERTAAEVRRLLSRGVDAQDIAVISPYYAQVRLLRDALTDTGVEVDTVDGFQGREKRAVVVDLVRSNERGEIGFLSDTRRMNVALTRARQFLLVIGDSATIGGQRYYADYLANVELQGGWVSAWTDEADPLST